MAQPRYRLLLISPETQPAFSTQRCSDHLPLPPNPPGPLFTLSPISKPFKTDFIPPTPPSHLIHGGLPTSGLQCRVSQHQPSLRGSPTGSAIPRPGWHRTPNPAGTGTGGHGASTPRDASVILQLHPARCQPGGGSGTRSQPPRPYKQRDRHSGASARRLALN